jgi:hypothetical protein
LPQHNNSETTEIKPAIPYILFSNSSMKPYFYRDIKFISMKVGHIDKNHTLCKFGS